MPSVRILVRVSPGAPRNEVQGFRDPAWRIRVAAPPVEGRANEALIAFLAQRLGVRKSQVSIVSGHKGRLKAVHIEGVSEKELQALLAGV